MKISHYFLTLLLAAAAVPAMAQEQEDIEMKVEYPANKHSVQTNGFWNNWFVSVGGGVQMYFGDHDRQMSFGDRLAPALDVAVGKWFTPEIGVRAVYSGLSMNGLTQSGIHDTGEEYNSKMWLNKQQFNFFNIHADVMFNLNNIFAGYKQERVWTISPYFGLGCLYTWEEPKETEISGNFGLYNAFKVWKGLDINLDIRGVLTNDRFDGETGGRSGEGILSATVGVTYNFGKLGWDRSKNITYYDNTQSNALRKELAAAEQENDRLRKELAAEQQKEKTVIVKKQIVAANYITFEIGKSNLNKQARASLGLMAEAIKASGAETIYVIYGYADAATGSKKVNQRISQKRAQAVYDCLVNEFGVSPDQLRIEAMGGVENMFYDDVRLSRATITKAEE